MSARRRGRAPTSLLLSFLDHELSPDEAAAVERTSVDSAAVRQQLETLRSLRRGLSAAVPALEQRPLGRELHAQAERRRNARGGAQTRERSPLSRVWFVGAAGVSLLVGLALGQLDPRPEEYPWGLDVGVRSKSGTAASSPSRWAGIQAFRLSPGGEPQRLRRSLHPEDGLLFAYTNLGGEPFERLMVFSVDAERELHWFYPAYVSERENPASIPIEVGQEQALSEVVWLDLPRGPLTIYAAFTREPLDVWSVEAWFAAHPGGGHGFAGDGAAVSELTVTVE